MAGRDPQIAGTVCERAREWSSLRLDGELSLLEEELLERHLGVCESCLFFAEGMRTSTSALREAQPEVPARRTAVPARRRRAAFSVERRRTALVAAAALVLGALVGSFFQGPSQSAPPGQSPQVSLLTNDVRQLRDIPRPLPRTLPAPVQSVPPNPPEGVI
ncbi:MAG: zf-HC2 domain-containing protein [Gaiellaceae bacterium]